MTNPRFSEEAIDGSTLEKRRDQRAAQLEEFVGSLTPEDRQGFLGYVNQWTKATGVKVVPAKHSLVDRTQPGNLRSAEFKGQFDESKLPPIVKRTYEQRIESFVKRLLGSPREQQEVLIRQVAAEYWKAGSPVSVDALRAVATHYLNQAERRRSEQLKG